MVVANPPELLGDPAPRPPDQHRTFLTIVCGLCSLLEEELVKLREEKNPGDLFLGVMMRDGEGVRGWSCLIWTPILSLLYKELGTHKPQHLNLSIVFLLGEGQEREKRDKRR